MESEFVLVDKEDIAGCNFPLEEVLKIRKRKKSIENGTRSCNFFR
jgi:hypothetical protein